MRDVARRVPAWAWLGGIVLVSAAFRIRLGRSMVAPFVFVDELIYSELGRSLADGAGYAVRDTPVSGYSLLYPALIAPAYALFDGLTGAYAAAKAIGAVSMSLAAVPVYLLARRVAGQWPSLLAALIAVAIPSMAYTATITTESLFYPLSLAVALALVLYLARPSWIRLLGLLAALAVAYATRAQALAFVPAVATAPLVLALLRARWGALRAFVPLYAVVLGGAIVVVALQAVRGRPLSALLGAYSVVGQGGYDVAEALRFWLWHVEELTLYSGIVPVAVVVVLLRLGRRLPSAAQEHLAATVALTCWSTLVVGTFASRFANDRIQDRYLFFLVPLLVVALVAWVELGAPRPQPVTVIAAIAALGLPLLFPYVRFIGEPAKADTLGLIPLWTINEHLVGGTYWGTVAIVGSAFVALFLLVPRHLALVVPVTLLVLFLVLSRPVWSGPHGFVAAGLGALRQGNPGLTRDWIDRATPVGSEVVVLWTGRADRFTVNQNEFFNRRVGRVLYTDQPTPGGIGETKVTRGSDGVYRDPGGRPIKARFALLDGSVTPDGTIVARNDVLGTALWRLRGPLASTTTVTGLYPNDTWSGPVVTWTKLRCTPGALTTTVRTDPTLFDARQTIEAETRGVSPRGHSRATVSAIAWVDADGPTTIRLPVRPNSRGTCVVRFTVEPTAVPSEVIPGSTDGRILGVHFDSFVYVPDGGAP